jgi:hypothetical protein
MTYFLQMSDAITQQMNATDLNNPKWNDSSLSWHTISWKCGTVFQMTSFQFLLLQLCFSAVPSYTYILPSNSG